MQDLKLVIHIINQVEVVATVEADIVHQEVLPLEEDKDLFRGDLLVAQVVSEALQQVLVEVHHLVEAIHLVVVLHLAVAHHLVSFGLYNS